MEQLNFFGITPPTPSKNDAEVFPKVRSWFGHKQYQDGKDQPWRFIVTGFDGTTETDGTCTVLLADGEEKDVPIDANNFITIRGKKYGPLEWDH